MGSYTRVDGGLSTVGSASLTGDLNFVVDTYFSEFINSIPLTAEAAVLPVVGGTGQVRDSQEAASLSPEFATALATYSAATTRDGQRALLDDLLLKWSETSNKQNKQQNKQGQTRMALS